MSDKKVDGPTYEELMEESVVMGELHDLLKLESGLSDWELGFVESVHQQFEESKSFTYKQEAEISKIWDKLCG